MNSSQLCAGRAASHPAVRLVCGEGAGADGSIPCYTVTGDTDSRQRQRQHLALPGTLSHISDLASPPTLGMTYSGGTDRAANNPSRYYYMRAKYGPPVMEGLERASKNTPTTQS